MGSAIAIRFSGLEPAFCNDFEAMLEASRIADDLGIGQIVLPDHVVMGARVDRYPHGQFPFAPEEPWLEPMTVLAAIAAVTSRVRLATGILIAPLRPAPLLAKTIATLDVISNGRLDLGIGTGWQREEYEASGVPFADRNERMEALVRACRELWREAPASFSSTTVSFEEIWCRPAPVQPGGPPLWFAGNASTATAQRVAALGTGWLPIGGTALEDVGEGIRLLRKAFLGAGRPAETVRAYADLLPAYDSAGRPNLELSLPGIAVLVDAGVTGITLASGAFARDREELRPFIERAARIEL